MEDNSGNGQVAVQAFLSRQGRKLVPTKPDGNCLFRSLATLLTGDQEDHLMLRNMLVDYELDVWCKPKSINCDKHGDGELRVYHLHNCDSVL